MLKTLRKKRKKPDIKTQRDRFLAFSFASADLFIEVSPKGKITFALGAAKSLTGVDHQELMNTKWLELFAADEHAGLLAIQEEAIPGLRCGPFMVSLDEKIAKRKGILTAIKMPNTDNLYLTLGLTNALMEQLSELMKDDESAALTTGFKAEDEKKTALTTDYKAEDLKEEASLTTGFEAEDLQDESLTTGYKAGDDEEIDALTTGYKAGTDEEVDALTTGYKAGDDEEIDALTTGYKAEADEEVDALTTGYKAEEDAQDEESLTTGYKAGAGEEVEALTTDYDAADSEQEGDNEALTTGFTAQDEDNEGPILDKEEFVDASEEAFELARKKNIEASVTIFEFEKTQTLPEEDWQKIVDELSEFLKEESIGGKAAAEIKDGQYSLLHDSSKDPAELEKKIAEISKNIDPAGEGIEVSSKTIKADLDELSGREAARALFYTINEFDKPGADLTIETLGEGLKKLVTSNEQKLKDFKNIIERIDFDIHFQPIVNLETKEAGHYEVLSRIRNDNIQEWVMFGEDVGLAANFDLAVIERTMNYIHYKAGTTRTKFSVNISPKSIEDETFFARLTKQLSERDFRTRLMFEITESTRILDLVKVDEFVKNLQKDGYEIALDDFGAGAASLEFLQSLRVNFVKIDGKYIRRMLNSEKDTALVKNIVKACHNLKTKVIAEFVEEQAQADALAEMGVQYAQGFLYGKAESKPDYTPR